MIVLDTTPFYSESGGQVGDEGAIFNDAAMFEVGDAKDQVRCVWPPRRAEDKYAQVGDSVTAHVNATLRAAVCATTRPRT